MDARESEIITIRYSPIRKPQSWKQVNISSFSHTPSPHLAGITISQGGQGPPQSIPSSQMIVPSTILWQFLSLSLQVGHGGQGPPQSTSISQDPWWQFCTSSLQLGSGTYVQGLISDGLSKVVPHSFSSQHFLVCIS